MTAPLIERQAPMDALARIVEKSSTGSGDLVVVEGPAGIGKTRLLRELVEHCLASRAADVLEASASELERSYPLGVVLQLLERVTRAEDTAADPFRGHAALAQLVLQGNQDDSAALNDEFALIHSLYWLVVNLADVQPLVLMIDDAQWADEQSLRFLHYLAQRVHDLPVAILVAVRTGDPATEGETLTRLMLESSLTLQLSELTREGTRELLAATLGRDDQLDVIVEQAWIATRGNPFLLREMAAAAGTEHGLTAATDWAPDSVTRSVTLRIHGLGPDAVALARAAAVLSGPSEIGTAARVAELSVEDALVAADRLRTAQIFGPGGAVTFHHPIIRSAVYARLSVQERLQHHRRAASLLHEQAAPDEEVSIHLQRTAPFAEPWVSTTLRAAARSAGRKGAPATGAVLLRRALEQDDLTTADRGETLIQLGIMEAAAGETESLTHLERALGLLAERSSPVTWCTRSDPSWLLFRP